MAAVAFGNTWWGEKWLDALTNVDYDNRLPRGKRYARNGSVERLSIEGSSVQADVRGSRPRPYKIRIGLKEFTGRQRAAVLDAVTRNPVMLSQLLTRRLPPALFDSFQAKGVALFPATWSELSARCSCPDWAACCKHIAAVIYLIANEIDKNPFVLFELHGLEIFAALEKMGYAAEEHAAITIPKAGSLVLAKPAKPRDGLSREARDGLFAKLDFSRVPVSRDLLISLLPGRPLFYLRKDFKALLEQALKSFARSNARALRAWNLGDEDAPRGMVFTAAKITIGEDLTLTGLELEPGRTGRPSRKAEDRMGLLRRLFEIPRKELHSHDQRVVFLSLLTHFALKLIEQGALQPEILAVAGGHRIRWLPALISPPVQEIFDTLCELSDSDLFETPRQSRPEQVKTVLSGLLGGLITHYAAGLPELCEPGIPALFFTGQILKTAKAFEARRDPEMIALWLSRFQISRKDRVPLVRIGEAEGGFTMDLAVEDRSADLSAPVPLAKILTLKKYAKARFGILKDFMLLAEYFPEIAGYLASGGKKPVVFSWSDFEAVLFRQLPLLGLLRIPVLLPKGLDALIRPRVTATLSREAAAQSARSYLSLEEMLNFRWQIALGDTLVSAVEFRRLVRGMNGIVKIKDQYVYLDEGEIEKLLRDIESEPRMGASEILQAALAEELDDGAIRFEAPARALIAALLETEPLPAPGSLRATLRDYQQRGYEWLIRNMRLGLGSLIADDMGLGKTIQVISLLLSLRDDGRLARQAALVVVPTTLLTNWTRETEMFAPELRVQTYHGGVRKLDPSACDLVLTTYALVRRDAAALQKHRWAAVILDEAQNIKNPGAAQTKAAKKLKGDLRIAMTGTPVENRLSDYWSIFDFLNKGYLKGAKAFNAEFAIPIEVERNREKLERFRRITAPFVLRRLKTDKSIIRDLPDKLELDQFCQLTKDQAALYQSAMDETLAAIEQADGIARRGLVLRLITRLKQVCNHPSHFLKKKSAAAEASGKTALLLQLLATMRENEEKVLIFTQYTEMGNLLQALIAEAQGPGALFLHGGLSRKKRDEMVDSFQSEPYVKVMLLSLKAGGTGLNLTAAQNVVHFDLWWNPAVEAQATDRAYRIGQTKNVMVHRLITRGTFEEKIDRMIKEKKELADLAVTAGEKWIGEFDDGELRDIFSLS